MMKFFAFIVLAAICSVGFGSEEITSYENHKVIEINPKSKAQYEALKQLRLTTDLDFWTEPNRINQPVHIRVAPEQWPYLNTIFNVTNMGHNVLDNNLEKTIEIERMSNLMKSRAGDILLTYARHSDMNDWMENLAKDNSDIAKVINIGKTYESREMKVFSIKSDKGPRNKEGIWLDAGIHAREWVTPSTAIYIINELVTGYKNGNSKIVDIVDKYNWYILPSANPDGYEYSTRVRMWRKTRSPQGQSIWGSGTCYGVDPNRNFDNHYGIAGVSSNPCSDIYNGKKAFSEKCAQNMANFWLSHKGELKTCFSLHSYSQLWFIPPGYTSAYVSDHKELMRIGNIGAKAIKAVNGRSFRVGTGPDLLYATSGDSADYAREQRGMTNAFTLELYPSSYYPGFVVPVSSMPGIAKETWAGILAAVQAI